MSSKKKDRKSLSESGTGNKVWGDIDELKRDIAGEGESPEDAGRPADAVGRPETGEQGAPDANQGEDAGRDTSEAEASQGTAGESGGKVRVTVYVDASVAERLRNAVYWTPSFVTLSSMAGDALQAAVEHVEERFNGGEPFPPRDEELKGGRPPR